MNTQALKNATIIPNWSAPANIKAYSTTRLGGMSSPPYDSLNLGAHCGDDAQTVRRNRQLLQNALELPSQPVWLKQIHSRNVIELPAPVDSEADAAFTRQARQVCAVLTADCMPVLFCNASGDCVAVAHAGWRGLVAGILENTLKTADFVPHLTYAWLGPAIGAQAFEVGDEVRQAFLAHSADTAKAFTPVREKPAHWLADLYLLATQRLQQVGVKHIFGGDFCTYGDKTRFFSYRRDNITGRMATLIYFS